MISEGRSPCINPRCRRTRKVEFGFQEVICGKCFRALPADLRNYHRYCWRGIRKWDRMIARTHDVFKVHRMQDVRNRYIGMLNRNWEDIRRAVVTPDKPEGLDQFLDELGI